MSALVLGDSVVHYEYFGRGRPVVFVHGWLGSWRYWVPAMDALSERYRVYALDLWGFGDSDKSRNRYTIDSYVDLLHAFVIELGMYAPIPLVGHTLGAVVAVSFGLQYPDLVGPIMTVSLPLGNGALNQRLLLGEGSLLDRLLGRCPTAGYADIEREARRAAFDAIQESVRSALEWSAMDRVGELRGPLLAVYGAQDTVVPPPNGDPLNRLGNSARVLVMPECKHFPMLDQSSQFNRLLVDFVDGPDDLSRLELKEEWKRRIR